MPLGAWALPHLNPAAFKLTLGLFLVVCCPTMLLAAPHAAPARRRALGRRLWSACCGGVMGGIGGFSGVLPSLWVTLRGWDKDLQRSVIQNFSLAALAATLASYVASGLATPDMWPKLAVVAPALLLPSLIGARIYHGLSPAAFRRVVLVLLTCAGAGHDRGRAAGPAAGVRSAAKRGAFRSGRRARVRRTLPGNCREPRA